MRTQRKLSETHKQLISQSMKKYWASIPQNAPINEDEHQCLCKLGKKCLCRGCRKYKQEIEEG